MASKNLFQRGLEWLLGPSKKAKPTDDLKEKLRITAPNKQYENDAKLWTEYLEATDANPEKQAVVQRIFTTLNQSDVKIYSRDQSYLRNNKESNLNLAATLSHGGRVMIKIPPIKDGEDPNKFFNWIAGGANKIFKERVLGDKNLGEKATKKGATLFRRGFATHSVKIDKNTNQPKEVKVSPFNVFKLLRDYFNDRHYGMNVGLNAVGNGNHAETGEKGHLYFYHLPPTKTSPGAVLIGCEGSEPGKVDQFGQKHGAAGKSGEFSPTGGLKFNNKIFNNGDVLPPTKYNGLQVQLDTKQIDSLTQTDPQTLASVTKNLAASIQKPISDTDINPNLKSSTELISKATARTKDALNGLINATKVNREPENAGSTSTAMNTHSHSLQEKPKETDTAENQDKNSATPSMRMTRSSG